MVALVLRQFRLLQDLHRDELAGNGLDAFSYQGAGQVRDQARLREHPDAAAYDPEDLCFAGEIFVQQPDDQFIGPERGQNVDKTEEPQLEVLVLHRPIHDAAEPPRGVERRRGAAHRGMDLPSRLLGLYLEINISVHDNKFIMNR